MASKEQFLIFNPPKELRFKGPFTFVVTVNLEITNPSDRPICFKVKTTAPKSYCVRPNNGTLKVKESSTVAVMLQPLDISPEMIERLKHKFMVLSMFAPDGEFENSDRLWREAPPGSLMEYKLKCVFELPDSSSRPDSSSQSDQPWWHKALNPGKKPDPGKEPDDINKPWEGAAKNYDPVEFH